MAYQAVSIDGKQIGQVLLSGTSRQFRIIFESEQIDAREFLWYQLMYREYTTPKGDLVKIDVASGSRQIYRSGEAKFRAERTSSWVLDARMNRADYPNKEGNQHTSKVNEIDDMPSWSTQIAFEANNEVYWTPSMTKTKRQFSGTSTMYFLDVLARKSGKETRQNVLPSGIPYDIVHQLLFKVTWSVTNNNAEGDGVLVALQEQDCHIVDSAKLAEVIDKWRTNAAKYQFNSVNLPILKPPFTFTAEEHIALGGKYKDLHAEYTTENAIPAKKR